MFLYVWIALAVLILDQITKWIVKLRMDLGDTIPVIGQFFHITSHRNKGAAFGILQGQTVFFLIVTVVFLAGIIWYLYKTYKAGEKWTPFALSLMLGGAIGNFLDRLIYGEVVDFLQFHFDFGFFDYDFPIFNVADSGIVVGTILILIITLVATKREAQQEAQQEAQGTKDTTHDSV